MSKYIVVRLAMGETVCDEDEEELGSEPGWSPSVVAPCENTSEVVDQLRQAKEAGDDWTLWEVVGKKTEKRAITYPYDKERAVIA